MPPKAQGNGDVAEVSASAVVAPSPFQLLIRKMAQLATLDEGTGTGRAPGEDINPILTAQTEEEMWDADELDKWNAQKLSGSHLQVLGFEVKFSTDSTGDIKTPFIDPATGKQMFLLVDSFRINDAGKKKEINLPPPGELFVWNTSARNIVGKLFWMLEHGWFDKGAPPVRLTIQGTELGGGRSVEKLKPLPPNTVIEAAEPIFAEVQDSAPF